MNEQTKKEMREIVDKYFGETKSSENKNEMILIGYACYFAMAIEMQSRCNVEQRERFNDFVKVHEDGMKRAAMEYWLSITTPRASKEASSQCERDNSRPTKRDQ